MENISLDIFRYFKSISYFTNRMFDLTISRIVLVFSELVLSLFALRKIDLSINYFDGRKKKFLIMGIIYLSIMVSIRVFAAFIYDYLIFGPEEFRDELANLMGS